MFFRIAATAALLFACLAAVSAGPSGSRRLLLGDPEVCHHIFLFEYGNMCNNVGIAFRAIHDTFDHGTPCNHTLVKQQVAVINSCLPLAQAALKKAQAAGCTKEQVDPSYVDFSRDFNSLPEDIPGGCPLPDCGKAQKFIDDNGAAIDTRVKSIIKTIGKSKCMTPQQTSEINSNFGPISGVQMSSSLELTHIGPYCPKLHAFKQLVTFPKIPKNC